MTNVVHRVNIDIVRGIDQKDTRWDDFAMSGFKKSSAPHAFWDVVTSVQPGRNDLRQLAKSRPQGIRAGERPGNLPSETYAPYTTVDPDACDQHVFYDDRVATLRLIKPLKKASTEPRMVVKTVGNEKVSYQEVTAVADDVSVGFTDPEGIEVLLETNSFLLQGARETFQEKYQISETFGEPVFFAFGKRQQIFQYDGMVFDTQTWQWKEKFIDNYENYLRGSKAIENGAIAILTTNTAIIRGYLLSCAIGQSDSTHGYAALSFSMFVVDRFPIEPILKSPQEIKASMDEDPTSAFFKIVNKTGRPGEVIKEIPLPGAVVALPDDPPHVQGFLGLDFGATRAWKPSAPVVVNGRSVETVMKYPAIPPGISNPPSIFFDESAPGEYLGKVILARLGKVGILAFMKVQVAADSAFVSSTGSPTDVPMPHKSMSFTEALRNNGTSTEESVIWHCGVPGNRLHSQTQVDQMIEQLKDKSGGGLTVLLVVNSAGYVSRDVKAIRRFRDNPSDFQSKFTTQNPFTSLGVNSQNAFEIEFTSPVTPADFGIPGPFKKTDNVRVQFYLKDAFVAMLGPKLYHISESNLAFVVGEANGTTRHVVSADKHVLTYPSGNFMGDVQPHIAAGDKVYVTLPYAVIDNAAPILEPTTKVTVVSVLNNTQLQLGLLTMNPYGDKNPKPQRLSAMISDACKLTVEKATSVTLIESAIKQFVKNPPTGAFDNQDISQCKVAAPRGVFELKEGVHFTP
jgi:hypothetical protein